ncbi:unnamed protein product [Effrenium voratum]|nr:unnamed protein product [Effrenium voratum]
MAPRGESGVGDKADRFAEKFWKESEKPAGIRPLQDEVASRYKEVVRREQALAARERLASEVCQAQEEREQDLEEFAERLKAQQEVGNSCLIDRVASRRLRNLLIDSHDTWRVKAVIH